MHCGGCSVAITRELGGGLSGGGEGLGKGVHGDG